MRIVDTPVFFYEILIEIHCQFIDFIAFKGYIDTPFKTNQFFNHRLHTSLQIEYEFDSTEFNSRSKDGEEGVFTRFRVFNIKSLIVLIMTMSRALQRELDDFYKKASSSDYSIRKVSKSAFTQARAKLNPWAFQRLNEVAEKSFYESAEYYVWHQMRLLAVDGTRLVLPNHKTTNEEFGVHHFGPNADQPRSMATASMLYDVLNLITIDAQIESYSTSEKDLLNKHLEKVKLNDLILLDEGYPSILLFFQIRKLAAHFCTRMKEDWWSEVRLFKNSTEIDRIVEFQLPIKYRKKIETEDQCQNNTILGFTD